MVKVKKEIEIIPENMFSKAIEKEDVIMVFKTNKSFLLCDKKYGIKYDDGFYKVMRIIGGGKNGNCSKQK